MRRAAVLEAAVGDGILLVDAGLVRAHGLNPSAAAVWRATTPAATVASVIERVADEVTLDDAAIEADVRTALADLAAEGLVQLGGQEPPPPVPVHERPGSFANVPATDEPEPEAFTTRPWPAPIGPFRGLDVAFDLATDDARLARVLDRIWAPLAIAPDATAATPVRHYRLGPDPTAADGAEPRARLLLSLDGHVVARLASAASTLALTVWHANQLVSTGTERFLQLHAGAVVVDGVAVLLPAAMNSGKSTLTTGLVLAGAAYLTDETVAIDPGRGTVLAYPKAISLDPGSWPLFPALEPAFARDEHDLGHRKWYVVPEAIRAGAAVTAGTDPDGAPAADVPVGAIVFPRYDPHAATTLEPFAPLDAAAALAANAFNLLALGQAGVDELVRLATATPCWTLTVGDLDAGVAAVLDAARRTGGSTLRT